MTVAALYVDPGGPYPKMSDVDCWDAERDARLYQGPHPIVAHPPCGPWGALSHFCTKQDASLAPLAVEQLRKWGGVLEHPAHSKLWTRLGLPKPGELDFDGLWTLEVEQVRWGHQAEKRTWLLFAGIPRCAVRHLPEKREPTHVVGKTKGPGRDRLPEMLKSRRHFSPPAFARWLVDLAAQARP